MATTSYARGSLETGAGSLSLGAGDDTLTLNDGAVISGAGIDAGAATTNDALVLNNAGALTFDGSMTAGFEIDQAEQRDCHDDRQPELRAGTPIDGGSTRCRRHAQTATVTLADGTTLNVDGSVQGVGHAGNDRGQHGRQHPAW